MRAGSRDPGAERETRELGGGRWRWSLSQKSWEWGNVVCYLSFVVFPLLLLWRPLFGGEAFFWGTPLLQFVPWQRMAAAMWREGHLPLWNPLVGCGAPLAANYQTAAFYPLNALSLVLPGEVALSWTIALHLTLTGWAMFRWSRAYGLDRLPAFIGAVALEGSGFLVARAALFPSVAFAFPWLAIWLWRAEILVQRWQLQDALWLGFSLGLGLLAGHAQTSFYGGVLLVAYLVFRAVQAARGKGRQPVPHIPHVSHRVLRLVGLTLCAFAVGAGLAAIQLLPTGELMLASQRSAGAGESGAMTYSLWPWRLISFVAPDFFGNPGRGDYWGYPNYWEGIGYVGVLPLLLAARAIAKGRRGKERADTGQVWFWIIVAAAGLLLALGDNTPVFPFLFRHVPSFNLFRAPARWLAVVTVALAALASWGAQWWPTGHRGRRLGSLGIASGVALVIGGMTAPRIVPGVSATFGPAIVWLGGNLAIAGVLALVRRDAVWWRATVGGLIALDLLIFGWSLVPTVDRSLYRGSTEVAASLHSEGGMARVYWPADPAEPNSEYGADYRVMYSYLTFEDFGPRNATYWREMRELLLPNAAMLDGVASVNNFDPLVVGEYVELLDGVVEAPALLQVMGASHVVSDRPWPGGEPIYESGLATVYRLPDGLGRAWIVGAGRQVGPDEMRSALADPEFDPRAAVVLEVGPSHVHDSDPASDGLQALSLRDTPNGVTIRANLDAPGYLVLADTWYPGWQARVDGEAVDILRANHAFRAVWLEAGQHIVEMRYRPASVSVGGAISLVTLTVFAAGLLLARRREVCG